MSFRLRASASGRVLGAAALSTGMALLMIACAPSRDVDDEVGPPNDNRGRVRTQDSGLSPANLADTGLGNESAADDTPDPSDPNDPSAGDDDHRAGEVDGGTESPDASDVVRDASVGDVDARDRDSAARTDAGRDASPDASKPCGNAKVDPGEMCDGTSMNCTELSSAYSGGKAVCNATCTGWNSSTCVSRSRPLLALIYKGPVACDGCESSIASMLKKCNMGWQTKYIGPNGEMPISAENLKTADLYAQPGGDGGPEQAFRNRSQDISAVKAWVKAGGRYLGICLGGYYAGSWVFNMLPGDADNYANSSGADIHSTEDTMVKVLWRDQPRTIFFQDGAYFKLNSGANATILARYKANKAIAAMVTAYGQGKVGVSGPHPEAEDGWGLHDPDGDDTEQGCDLVKTLMTAN